MVLGRKMNATGKRVRVPGGALVLVECRGDIDNVAPGELWWWLVQPAGLHRGARLAPRAATRGSHTTPASTYTC